MAEIPQQTGDVQARKVGVESAHGFGDCLFNAPLIKAIGEKHGTTVDVTVRPHCADAFTNFPFIGKIIHVQEMNHGVRLLRQQGYQHVYQITQNVKFFEFRQHDNHHSLIDTPALTGKQIGVEFDPRPLFAASPKELAAASSLPDVPTIAIESVYKSAQSWAQRNHVMEIVEKFKSTHRILWLSNEGCPNAPNIDNMLRFSRRECIMCLQKCSYFFSVGSGFFCASLALPKECQPKHIVCLWTDDLYRYEGRLSEFKWHPQITWIHNARDLTTALQIIR